MPQGDKTVTKERFRGLIIILFFVYCVGFYTLIFKPLLPEVESILNHTLFTLSLQSFLLLLACSILMLHKWYQGGKENDAHKHWGIAFGVYSILFFGLVLQSMGVEIADMNNPVIFFIWRQVMILWLAMVFYGIAKVVFVDKRIHAISTIIIIISGYLIFSYGLIFGPGDIELTMYAFLNIIFVPVVFLISYLFYIYWRMTVTPSSGVLSLGFAGLGVTYMAWAPWHLTNFYFVWFSLFVLSLVVILVGLCLIKQSSKEKTLNKN